MPEPVKKTPPKEEKKGLLGKLKEAADDKEEQLFILSAFAVSYTHLTLPTNREV